MEVRTWTQTTEKTCYATQTHSFSINTDKLEKIKEHKNFKAKIAKMLAKGLRVIVDAADGTQWQLSFAAIYNEIVGEYWSPNGY